MTARPRVALFIDAENVTPAFVQHYIDHCRSLGRLTVARCYGSGNALKAWEGEAARHHLVPVQTPPGASKANASDFALTIDAVSLLHRDIFDHAVIASSDADFTQLAIHIREHGKGVDGIGETKATPALRSAFDNYTAILPPPAAAPGAAMPAPCPSRFEAELLSTFRRLRSAGKVTLPVFGKAFREAHPAIELGKGKLKKSLLAAGLAVDDKQEISSKT